MIKDSIQAQEKRDLPPEGPDRYFVWLCHLNGKLIPTLRLSDVELKMLAHIMAKKIKY
jgi:hypothetical protein